MTPPVLHSYWRSAAATRGNQMRAAGVLGLNRNTLRKRLHDLGIEKARAR